MTDFKDFVATLMKMRRPQIRIHPADARVMSPLTFPLVTAAGIEMVIDDSVLEGQMQAVEMDALPPGEPGGGS